MQDRELYQQILGIMSPWRVRDVELDMKEGEVVVLLEHDADAKFSCPECGRPSPIHDHAAERRWRHLDTCQMKTVIQASVPRTNCGEHGVRQVRVSWAEPHSRFTLLFERLVIDWIKATGSQDAVRARLGLSWDEVHGVMERAVKRGLALRKAEPIKHLGIDEKSYKKRHRYVTIVSSLGGEGEEARVLYVAEERKEASLDAFWSSLTAEQLNAIEGVAIDMWEPYENSVRKHVPNAGEKIVYDKFHVIAHLSKAVDEVRREENAELRKLGDDRLKGTRYSWLTRPLNMTREQLDDFFTLRMKTASLRTARAWALMMMATAIWDYRYAGLARKLFQRWHAWAIRSRLEPMIRVARMMKSRLENILTYAKHRITNAVSESMNSKIQWVKYTARGFRNINNFITAIYFHCGGLELTPTPSTPTH